MAMKELKQKLGEYKKYVIMLGATLVFSAYMLWPEGGLVPEATENKSELDIMLEQLNDPNRTDDTQTAGTRPAYRPIDRNNIGVTGGGSVADPTVFDSSIQRIEGFFVGYGTKSEGSQNYPVLFVSTAREEGDDDQEVIGYTLDLREYAEENTVPKFSEGQRIVVFGIPSGKTSFVVNSFAQEG